ncbi:GNAT family N-acetyltransferase [Mammaliicoccus sciuri]|uniref:GNAT family N-acetyltransferase n=1 Tax=Mammaliicoccus sciuri TaxID=1296 RepID=UPI001C50001D|nr:GNAT family N-acetyltransferase [Mammaliicoccus sciuri]MCD3220952.1 GNAT family N-acetyltransferase [Mammaliicoccus sciuri]
MIRKFKDSDFNNVVNYIYLRNKHSKTKIGYVGDVKSEIEKTLKQDFSDLSLNESIFILTEKEEIKVLFALDVDKENRSIEVWGPYYNDETSLEEMDKVWRYILDSNFNGYKFLFFINTENKIAIDFVDHYLKCNKQGEHVDLVYKLNEKLEKHESIKNVKVVEKEYSENIVTIHNNLFKGSYYNGENLFSNLKKEEVKLDILEHDFFGEIGYLYCEKSDEDQEIYVDYIGIDLKYQGRHYSEELMYHLLKSIDINKYKYIRTCVDSSNNRALNMFEKFNFDIEYTNLLYTINI